MARFVVILFAVVANERRRCGYRVTIIKARFGILYLGPDLFQQFLHLSDQTILIHHSHLAEFFFFLKKFLARTFNSIFYIFINLFYIVCFMKFQLYDSKQVAVLANENAKISFFFPFLKILLHTLHDIKQNKISLSLSLSHFLSRYYFLYISIKFL